MNKEYTSDAVSNDKVAWWFRNDYSNEWGWNWMFLSRVGKEDTIQDFEERLQEIRREYESNGNTLKIKTFEELYAKSQTKGSDSSISQVRRDIMKTNALARKATKLMIDNSLNPITRFKKLKRISDLAHEIIYRPII